MNGVEISEIFRNVGLVAAAATGLWIAGSRARAATRQADAALEQSDTARNVHVNSAFGQAIEHLAHERRAVRLGGVFSLIGLFSDHPQLRVAVLGILNAHLAEEMVVGRERDVIIAFLRDRSEGM